MVQERKQMFCYRLAKVLRVNKLLQRTQMFCHKMQSFTVERIDFAREHMFVKCYILWGNNTFVRELKISQENRMY